MCLLLQPLANPNLYYQMVYVRAVDDRPDRSLPAASPRKQVLSGTPRSQKRDLGHPFNIPPAPWSKAQRDTLTVPSPGHFVTLAAVVSEVTRKLFPGGRFGGNRDGYG